MPPVTIGDVMRGGGIGRVVASNSARWSVGALVSGLLGWQDYCLAREGDMFAPRTLPKDLLVPLPVMLGACGTTGGHRVFRPTCVRYFVVSAVVRFL